MPFASHALSETSISACPPGVAGGESITSLFYLKNVLAAVTVVVLAAMVLFVSPIELLLQALFYQFPWLSSDAALSVYAVTWVGGVLALANFY